MDGATRALNVPYYFIPWFKVPPRSRYRYNLVLKLNYARRRILAVLNLTVMFANAV